MSLLLSAVNQIMTLLQSEIGVSGFLLALMPHVVRLVTNVLLVHLLLSVLRHVVMMLFVVLFVMLLVFVMRLMMH